METVYSGEEWIKQASAFERSGDLKRAALCASEAEKHEAELTWINQYDLAFIFRNVGQHQKAIFWLIRAANSGDPDAQKDLFTLYDIELELAPRLLNRGKYVQYKYCE